MILLRAAATSRPKHCTPNEFGPTNLRAFLRRGVPTGDLAMRALTYTLLRPLFCAVLAAVVAGCAQVSPAAKSGIERMYVFYCGETQVPDVSPWAPGTAPGT